MLIVKSLYGKCRELFKLDFNQKHLAISLGFVFVCLRQSFPPPPNQMEQRLEGEFNTRLVFIITITGLLYFELCLKLITVAI